jgi:hypothetical protein
MQIHIAGLAVLIGDNGRQRCAWCGEILFDVDHALVMVAPNADGSPGEGPRPWKMGDLIAVDGCASWVVPCGEDDPLPVGCCAKPLHLRLLPTPGGG